MLGSASFQTGKIDDYLEIVTDTMGADMVKNEIDEANSSSTFRRQDAERPYEGVIQLQLTRDVRPWVGCPGFVNLCPAPGIVSGELNGDQQSQDYNKIVEMNLT